MYFVILYLPNIFFRKYSSITVSDLKDIILDPENTPDRIKKIELLKKKIDTIVEDGHYDCDDVFLDHDYTESTSFECIVYYLAGYTHIYFLFD